MNEKLEAAKAREWYYKFELPDGSTAKSYLPEEVHGIHATRLKTLRQVIADKVKDPSGLSAIDLASHEGFYSIELARHFATVRGLEYRPENIDGARLISEVLGVPNVSFEHADLRYIRADPQPCADFVLAYGLLYHLEDPIHVLRLACSMARTHILVESQIVPFELGGRIEQGSYKWQRNIEGVFSLTADSPNQSGGGPTNICLTPSRNALINLLKRFGFGEIDVAKPEKDDYEQFVRGQRIIIYARRTSNGA